MPRGDQLFSRDVDLFEYGYVDSAGVVALVVWLEERYGIELSDEELFDERFCTINGIASIITSHITASAD